LATDDLGFFRWGRMAGKVLLTNDAGEWAFLTEQEFDDLLAGRVAAGTRASTSFSARGSSATAGTSMPSRLAWRSAIATCGAGPICTCSA
jgi:hypothetical protein